MLQVPNDPTIYTLGAMPGNGGEHTVVLACLSKFANNNAAVSVTNVVRSFPTISDVIMVGIAAGVPRPDRPAAHVRLGDVLVSAGQGVVQFDLGAQLPAGFEVRPSTAPPSARLLQAVNMLESDFLTGRRVWPDLVKEHLAAARVTRPRHESKLFNHPIDREREKGVPRIFRGKIGASNALMKDAVKRDELAKKHGLLGFEMEGSGVADASWEGGVGYLVVRGVCDYGDELKDDAWQAYAAHVAATYAAAVLTELPTQPSQEQPPASEARTGAHPNDATRVSDARLTACAWADDNMVVTAGFDGFLYAVRDGAVVDSKRISDSIVRVVASTPDTSAIATGDDAGNVRIIHADTSTNIATGAAPVYAIAFVDSGRFLTATRDGRITEWRQSGSAQRLRVVHEHEGAAFAVVVDRALGRCVSAGADGYLRTTSLSSGEQSKKRISDAALFSLAVSNNGTLATGDAEGNLWLLREGATQRLEGHEDNVRACRISSGGTWLVSGSKDGSVRLWHLPSRRVWLLHNAKDYIYDVALSSKTDRIAIADGSGTLTVVTLPASLDTATLDDFARFES